MAKKAAKSVKKAKKQPSTAARSRPASAGRRAASSEVNSSVDGLGASMKASYRSNFLRKSR